MPRFAQNLAWIISLVGMLSIGSGGARVLHHHTGDVCRVGVESNRQYDPHQHCCERDSGDEHAIAPATPANDRKPAPGNDEEHCVTCQLISVFSKVGVSVAHAILLFVEPQTIDIVVTRHESVSSHSHFDPHVPRGPPLA